jgi:peroxiredoxin
VVNLRPLIVVALVAVGIGVATYVVDQPLAEDSRFTPLAEPGESVAPAPVAGHPAPEFTVHTIDGQEVSLASLQGRPVWLTFGASWCVDCRVEAPDLQATYEQFRDDGLVVLQVSVGEDEPAIRSYAERVGQTFTLAPDPGGRIADLYGVIGLPTHLFIDRDGMVRELRLGGMLPDQMATSAEAIVRGAS